MEAGSALDPIPLAGFKDFYQYASTTRVISGRDLLESTGFEFQKEGARRVFVVTDEVIRGTGLVDGGGGHRRRRSRGRGRLRRRSPGLLDRGLRRAARPRPRRPAPTRSWPWAAAR